MDRFLATLTFFTRLPLWRWKEIPADSYKRVVELWPLAGWLTGLLTAAVLLCCSMILPPLPSVMIAFAIRAVFTGALHEDGLADFFDGFGGGTSRQRILEIMKDSHIGTYGVIGILFYYLLIIGVLSELPPYIAALVILTGDPWSKCCAAQIINFLPYARTAQQAKNKTVYTRMSPLALIGCAILGAAPLVAVACFCNFGFLYTAAAAPVLVSAGLILYFRHKIQGYTGDCCGATALLSELSFCITTLALCLR